MMFDLRLITEPATLITDYLLAAFTAALALRLGVFATPSQRWWAVAFWATGVASIAGGSVHGFHRVLPEMVTDALWLVSLESLLVAGFATVAATWRPMTPVAFAYAMYGVWVFNHPRFVYAIVGYGAALLILTAAHLRRWIASGRAGSAWMLLGVLVSVVAAAVQQLGLDLHRSFNHNDLYHVIQAVAIWMLYRGALAEVPTGKVAAESLW